MSWRHPRIIPCHHCGKQVDEFYGHHASDCVAFAVAAERSRIVAWLRTDPGEPISECQYVTARMPKELAEAIERGDHLGGEK